MDILIAFAKLNAMLGEMKALPIDEYVVIYNPKHKDVLVTKARQTQMNQFYIGIILLLSIAYYVQ